MIKHQQNHVRLLELRQTSESLDETIKNTIRLLAETRKEIQSIPPADMSDRREVDVHELLAYAKFIAPTTVPPTFRRPLCEPPRSHAPTADATPATLPEARIANGMVTPPPHTQDAPAPEPPSSYHTYTHGAEADNAAQKALDEKDRAWLNPAASLPFEPWPSQSVIMNGALANVQRMVEQGIDPAHVLSVEEQEEADRKRKEREEADRKRQEEIERRNAEAFGMAQRRRRTIEEDVMFNPDDL